MYFYVVIFDNILSKEECRFGGDILSGQSSPAMRGASGTPGLRRKEEVWDSFH
jgi:hypothetical protein